MECGFPFVFGGEDPNRFCTNEGFSILPDNSLWRVRFQPSGNTGPSAYLKNPNDPMDVGFLTYVSDENKNNVEQTAFVSPILDVSQISTLEVKFNYVINGKDVDSLCRQFSFSFSSSYSSTDMNLVKNFLLSFFLSFTCFEFLHFPI